MRLLDVDSLELSEFFGENIPRYAILSHVWGPEEVVFQDMQSARRREAAKKKQGFKKIDGCCRQAKQDGYKWAWIDSCCIDKSSSAELSEAINSMFQWYKESAVCYVYLVDVSARKSTSAVHGALRDSNWFTRGWTLQELLAPRHLVFFDTDWAAFGHIRKGTSLESRPEAATTEDLTLTVSILCTRIPKKYLTGEAPLNRACIAQRMCWASRRQTTRAEDRAYSLLGLFDISMPILYGEGLAKAFARLQAEIMKETPDQTILAWHLTNGTSYRLLAESPDEFINSGEVRQLRGGTSYPTAWSSFYLTNLGLSITLPITTAAEEQQLNRGAIVEAGLKCTMPDYWNPTSEGFVPGSRLRRRIGLSILFFDRDSDGRPIFICRRPPRWVFTSVQGTPTSIMLARNSNSRSELMTPNPSGGLLSLNMSLPIVSRGMQILSVETGIKQDRLHDALALESIGVDSLLALTIAGRVYEELGVPVIGIIAQCRTIGDFRLQLHAWQASPSSTQRKESSPPAPSSDLGASQKATREASSVLIAYNMSPGPIKNLFLAPNAVGDVVDWPPFAQVGWAVWGLSLSLPRPYCKVEQKAAWLIGEIIQRQPKGPYFLAGWSNGGILAYEVARQLIQSGEEVEHLFVIDDLCPLNAKSTSGSAEFMARFCWEYARNHDKLQDKKLENKTHVSKLYQSIEAIRGYVAKPIAVDRCPSAMIFWAEDNMKPDKDSHWDDMDTEKPTPGHHPLFPLRFRDGFGPNGWDKYLDKDKIQIERVKCNHFEILSHVPSFIYNVLKPTK